MVNQSDWVNPLAEEPKSYPGTLRGYRDFSDIRSRLDSVSAGHSYDPIGENDSWQAKCTKHESHEAPVKECTCGFYINYFSVESFYTETNKPRGVVEASGRVVLARKGFRSQKMKLIALWTPYSQLWKYMESEMPHVKLFWDKNEMHDTYPQEDLTSLIGTKESRLLAAMQQEALNLDSWKDMGTVQNFNYGGVPFSSGTVYIDPLSSIQAANSYIMQKYTQTYRVPPSYHNYSTQLSPSPPLIINVKDGGQLIIDGQSKTVQFYAGYNSSYSALEKLYFDTCIVQNLPNPVHGLPDVQKIRIENSFMTIDVNATEGTYVITQKI